MGVLVGQGGTGATRTTSSKHLFPFESKALQSSVYARFVPTAAFSLLCLLSASALVFRLPFARQSVPNIRKDRRQECGGASYLSVDGVLEASAGCIAVLEELSSCSNYAAIVVVVVVARRAGNFCKMHKSSMDAEIGRDGHSHEVSVSWNEKIAGWWKDLSVFGIAIGYCLSAALLSIINKWAIMEFPFPGALTALQYATSAGAVYLLGRFNVLQHDELNLKTMWRFLPAAICFYLSLFTNSELLLHANVDTFIVFRSIVPLFVAVGETVYLKQPWPSSKTWLALAVIMGGSVIYVSTDTGFNFHAYGWALAYLASMSIDFVYIKHIVMTIGLNTWGLVLYNNLEALLLFPIELFLMGEGLQLQSETTEHSIEWASFGVWLPVGLSCLFGLSISFFGFSCRRTISATGFTVLGVVNKLLTVLINLVIWNRHASAIGTVGLLICISGGVLYQQTTTKPKPAAIIKPSEASEQDEEKMMLVPDARLEHKGKESSDN